jgi:hypothetical protein
MNVQWALGSAHNRRRDATGPPTQKCASKSREVCKISEAGNSIREANYSRDTINIRENSSNRDNRNILDINSRLPESDSRKVNNSRDASNIQHQYQQQLQELTTRTLATAAETI